MINHPAAAGLSSGFKGGGGMGDFSALQVSTFASLLVSRGLGTVPISPCNHCHGIVPPRHFPPSETSLSHATVLSPPLQYPPLPRIEVLTP